MAEFVHDCRRFHIVGIVDIEDYFYGVVFELREVVVHSEDFFKTGLRVEKSMRRSFSEFFKILRCLCSSEYYRQLFEIVRYGLSWSFGVCRVAFEEMERRGDFFVGTP